jgi:hypothetical protein
MTHDAAEVAAFRDEAIAATSDLKRWNKAIRDERFIDQEPVAFKVKRRAEAGLAYCRLVIAICRIRQLETENANV